MFSVALFTIAKTQKEPKFASTDEWILKGYSPIHERMRTHSHNSAIKKKILPFATWVDLEGILKSEINQRKSNTIYTISLTCGIKQPKNKLADTENR